MPYDMLQSRYLRIGVNISMALVCVHIFAFIQYKLVYPESFRLSYPRYKVVTAASPVNMPLESKQRASKRILVYTSFFGEKPWGFLKPSLNYTNRCACQVSAECEITYDQNLANQSDLVLFHGRDNLNLKNIQSQRPKNQLWMYFIMENPYYTPSVRDIDKYFNLTASYRVESDVQVIYTWGAKPRKINTPFNLTQTNYAKGKSKQIAWAVSNCGQKREKLAKRLHEYGLQVDNYGKCKRPFLNQRKGKPVYHEYKFYFAAENKLCKDYITEKYWGWSFRENANMVPIVFGGADYSDPRLAISGSFIDAFQFSSPKKLADYLLAVDKNDTLYNEYFAWKRHWTLQDIQRGPNCSPLACELCEKLHADTWKFRKNPLVYTINVVKECRSKEQFFDKWIRT